MTDDSRRPSLLEQLKERRVVRVAIGYAAAAFVVLEAADLLLPALLVPDWVYRALVVVTLAGFPVALVLAWVFELSPEGVRLTSAEGRLVARVRPWVIYAGGALLLLLLVGGSLIWVRPRILAGEVAPGAEVIAVLPFTAAGRDVEGMGEGLVDLLSRNLDEVGVIRTVDPRTVLHRWSQASANGRLPREEALALARRVGAGSALTGSVVSAAGRVEINADLLGLDGSRLATASVEGEAHEVLDLVDSLSVALLREIWRGGGPLPTVDIGAISTSNLTAIRSFLSGEQHYRASDWAWAVQAFERAIEADSSFALAYYRLSRAAGWTGRVTRSREWYAEMAARYADRLPRRARKLVYAERLELEGQWLEAIDTLRALVQQYPDDPEIWQALADAEYHEFDEGEILGARPVREQYRAFDRLLELDPGFVPAMIHPLEIAFRYRDTVRIERYHDALSSLSAVAPATVRIVEDGLAAIRRPGDLVGLMSALSVTIQALDGERTDLRWQMARAVIRGLRAVAATRPAEESGVVIDWLRGRLADSDEDYGAGAAATLLELAVATGRLDLAGELLDSEVGSMLDPYTRRHFERLPILGGHTPLTYADTARIEGEGARVLRVGAALVLAIDRGEPRSFLEAMRSRGTRLDPVDGDAEEGRRAIEALLDVAAGFARAAEGEVEAGIEDVERTLRAGGLTQVELLDALWYRWLQFLALDDEGRERALRILGRSWPGSPIYEVRRLHLLGLASLAAGDSAAAREAYGSFVRVLAQADPEARIQADVEAVRAWLEAHPVQAD